jgi:hypothetical protein
LWSSNSYSLWTFVFTIGSILTFILAFWVFNLFDFYATQDIYEEFRYVIYEPTSYLVLLLIGAGLAIFDNGIPIVKSVFFHLNREIERRIFASSLAEAEREREQEEKRKKAAKDRSIIHRRLTNINCKDTSPI